MDELKDRAPIATTLGDACSYLQELAQSTLEREVMKTAFGPCPPSLVRAAQDVLTAIECLAGELDQQDEIRFGLSVEPVTEFYRALSRGDTNPNEQTKVIRDLFIGIGVSVSEQEVESFYVSDPREITERNGGRAGGPREFALDRCGDVFLKIRRSQAIKYWRSWKTKRAAISALASFKLNLEAVLASNGKNGWPA